MVLLNKTEFDNRIPPAGFVNAEFEAFSALQLERPTPMVNTGMIPIPDSRWSHPSGRNAAAQTTTPDYINSLLDNNVTDENGIIAWSLWNDPEIGAVRFRSTWTPWFSIWNLRCVAM